MEHIGKVVGIKGDYAIIEFKNIHCAGCLSKSICNVDALNQAVTAINSIGAKVGDTVKIELPPGITVFISSVLFLFPIIFFFFGFFLSKILLFKEIYCVMFGVIFLLLYLFSLKFITKLLSKKTKFYIKEIINGNT